jgi:hypothetical protein
MPLAHPELASGRWMTMSILEQLGNVGSEVDRALRAWEQGQTDRWDRALARALELFDLTVAHERWAGPRRREVLRAREYFCVFFDPSAEPDRSDYLRKYVLQFAVAARHRADLCGRAGNTVPDDRGNTVAIVLSRPDHRSVELHDLRPFGET